MSQRTAHTVNIPLNRVQGDLELTIEIVDNQVTDAWSKGTMYRGFENMLKGRGARDGLVLTPRVCGLCGTAHLFAAVKALDMICGTPPPRNAILVRNLTLLAENVQSDIRHGILIYLKDFLNPAYSDHPLYEEALRRYESFHGESVIETIRMTKKILEIVAILGGQWPNSSFMVPGGIAGSPSFNDLVSCKYIVGLFRSWYEQRMLGCSIERWQEVQSESDLQRWMNEKESHFKSDIGFFIRFSHSIKLHELGHGFDNFLSFGQCQLPPTDTNIPASTLPASFIPGVLSGKTRSDLNQHEISEHVAYSHFKDYAGGRHPFNGETRPHVTRYENVKYSFSKAPRYNDLPTETGPLAQMMVSGENLFRDIVRNRGTNAYVRELARLVRPAISLPIMQSWLKDIEPAAPFYTQVNHIPDGSGYGLIDASRGALGHWVKIVDGRIAHYQIITPTAWNGSPRDQNNIRGPWEEAVVGTRLRDPENPVEVEHIVRSFDPCQVCSVHTAKKR
jgi:hydrogenase large subunit